MEKKNEMFNRLTEETKKSCVESECLYFDMRRTHDVLAGYDVPDNIKEEYGISVLSPKIEIQYDDERLNQLLPGRAGEWTDDEDSYLILYKLIKEKDNFHYDYDIKISKYSDIGNFLYNKITDFEDIGEPYVYRSSVYYLSNSEDVKNIESIRSNLLSSITNNCIDQKG